MNFAELAVQRRTLVLFATMLMTVAGLWAYVHLGQLEDPEFSIKTALVITNYPGASPQEVEEQVTDVIEKAVQQMGSLDKVRSISKTGQSIVYVDMKESYRADKLPQIWDELRRKIHDVQMKLPPGVYPSVVKDDFGDVYGIFFALTGDGYSYAELKDYANILQRELLQVPHVARVEIWGTQKECIIVEISRPKLAQSRVHPQDVVAILQQQNMVVNSGMMEIGRERIRLAPTGTFQSVDEIGDLVVRAGATGDLIALRDVATIRRSYVDPPEMMMRFNGKPAIGIALSTVQGGNVVDMGKGVKEQVQSIIKQFPLGINLEIVSFQADAVKTAVDDFIINLIESVIIVVGVLLLTMGVQSGLLIGSGLIFTIIGTFIVMALMKIDLQRTSLGALIIAMGMLVDNAIVVVEGSLIRLQKGERRDIAITRPVLETQWPLLGATLVAIVAFIPIYLADNNTGEYCSSLFLVVAISLLLSWVIAVTVTPVCCDIFLHVPKQNQTSDPYAGGTYRFYKWLLETSLRHRMEVILIMVLLFVLAIGGFRYVRRIFFPEATRAQFMVDYWLPEGSSIHRVSSDLKKVEQYLLKLTEVKNIATCIGSGPPRFYLPYEPELPNSSYGQIIVNVHNAEDIPKLKDQIDKYFAEKFVDAEPRVRFFGIGPSVPFKIEARFSGPDHTVLRKLADKAKQIMREHPNSQYTRDDWRQRVKKWVPVYSQPKARWASISRLHVAVSLQRVSDGFPVGYYREKEEIMPILLKAPVKERQDISNLYHVPVWGYGTISVPLQQIVSDTKIEEENPIIRRRNRRVTITAQCDAYKISADLMRKQIKEKIEAVIPSFSDVPRSSEYRLEWGGEYDSSQRAQKYVFKNLPVMLILMAIIVVSLFNAFRQPLIIFLTLPLSIIGISPGLVLTDQPFGFMALLGALSLFGMLIKNAVVLLDQVDLEIRSGRDPYLAVVESSVSRLRPVMMASLTTVLGMAPLIYDTLFASMAVAIMFGLTFATLLTLIFVPILYAVFFRIHPKKTATTDENFSHSPAQQ